MSGTAGSGTATRTGFEGTARDFWESRPRRPRRGRKIAGVAAGIGERYEIDPVIVRVVLVVAAVLGGGLGLLVYVLGWLLLPDEGDEVSAAEALIGRGRSSMSHGLTAVLCIALFPLSGMTFGPSWLGGTAIVGIALLGTGMYLLHRNRGHLNRPASAYATSAGAAPVFFRAEPETDGGAGEAGASGGVSGGASGGAPDGVAGGGVSGVSGGGVSGAPGGWDPLGADPTAWALPDAAESAPHAPHTPRPPRRRSPLAAITFALALLTAAVGTVLLVFGQEWFTPAHVIGLTLAVLGLGMVAGAFTGGTRGLAALAVPLAIAGLLLTAVPFDDLPDGGWDPIDDKPTSLEDLRSVYERTGGEIKLDLTELPPSSEPIEVKAAVGMGHIEITVPEDADVKYVCSTNVGEVNCLGDEQSGAGPELTVRHSSEGSGDQQFILNVSAKVGQVEVLRG